MIMLRACFIRSQRDAYIIIILYTPLLRTHNKRMPECHGITQKEQFTHATPCWQRCWVHTCQEYMPFVAVIEPPEDNRAKWCRPNQILYAYWHTLPSKRYVQKCSEWKKEGETLWRNGTRFKKENIELRHMPPRWAFTTRRRPAMSLHQREEVLGAALNSMFVTRRLFKCHATLSNLNRKSFEHTIILVVYTYI